MHASYPTTESENNSWGFIAQEAGDAALSCIAPVLSEGPGLVLFMLL